MPKYNSLSFFSFKKNTQNNILRKQEILTRFAINAFSNDCYIENFRNNPVMIIEDEVIMRNANATALTRNVYFFENGNPSVTYQNVSCKFDVNTIPADLQQLIEKSTCWCYRIAYTWNADNQLSEIDFSTPDESRWKNKFTYGEDKLVTIGYNVSDYFGKTSVRYIHLPNGEGFDFRYSDSFDSGKELRAFKKGGHLVIQSRIIGLGRIRTENKFYYNSDNILTKMEDIEGRKIIRYIKKSLDKEGNPILIDDSDDGKSTIMYRYDEKGNFIYRRTETAHRIARETYRFISYTNW